MNAYNRCGEHSAAATTLFEIASVKGHGAIFENLNLR